MTLIDSHCHLDFRQFDADRDAILERARTSGVSTLINPGADLDSSRGAVDIADRYDCVYAAVGIHPHHASTLNRQALDQLRQLAAHPKVLAIGEIGLDYYRDLSPRPQQRSAFEAQLDLAADLDKPVIIHCREADPDMASILEHWCNNEDDHPGGVLHAFTGNPLLAETAQKIGFYMGIGGPLTFKNARQLPQIVPHLPLECLLIETDAPFLTPHPHRGQRNEPAYLPLIARRLAELRDQPLDLLTRQLTANTRQLFRIPQPTA